MNAETLLFLKRFANPSEMYLLCDRDLDFIGANRLRGTALQQAVRTHSLSCYLSPADWLRCENLLENPGQDGIILRLHRFHGYSFGYAMAVACFSSSYMVLYLFRTLRTLQESPIVAGPLSEFLAKTVRNTVAKAGEAIERFSEPTLPPVSALPALHAEQTVAELRRLAAEQLSAASLLAVFLSWPEETDLSAETFDFRALTNRIIAETAAPSPWLDARLTADPETPEEPVLLPVRLCLPAFLKLVLSLLTVLNKVSLDRVIHFGFRCHGGQDLLLRISTGQSRIPLLPCQTEDMLCLGRAVPAIALPLSVASFLAGRLGYPLTAVCDENGRFSFSLLLDRPLGEEAEFKSRDQFASFASVYREAFQVVFGGTPPSADG